MNVEQLERVRVLIASIRAELQTDSTGTGVISSAVGDLYEVVTDELKDQVWMRYLEDVA